MILSSEQRFSPTFFATDLQLEGSFAACNSLILNGEDTKSWLIRAVMSTCKWFVYSVIWAVIIGLHNKGLANMAQTYRFEAKMSSGLVN
jgi:hypothetical protein